MMVYLTHRTWRYMNVSRFGHFGLATTDGMTASEIIENMIISLQRDALR